MKIPASYLILVIILMLSFQTFAQELYTARGYWVESTKEAYRKLIQKQEKGDSLTINEAAYIQDYQTYLANYFTRLPEAEKIRYEQMKHEWNRELLTLPKPQVPSEEFEWRSRDRIFNTLYGAYYGISLVNIIGLENAAAVGVPIITGGLWLMGPVMFPKKYEGIDRSTVRAGFTGKYLGLLYGGVLGSFFSADSANADKIFLGSSTVGSIALGEIFFQLQKKRNYSEGYIEMVRHYGFIAPWITTSILLSTGAQRLDNPYLFSSSLLAGGAASLIIANKVSKQYDYTKGDVDAISSLSIISTGLGFALMVESFKTTESSGLLLIPTAGTILGTVLGQRAVKGAHLTKKQGSTINFSSFGAALIGFGVVAITESESPTVWLAVPSGLALITHQLLFYRYKRANLLGGSEGRIRRNHNFQFCMNVMPENYWINQKLPAREYNPRTNTQIANPLVKLKLTF